VDRLDQKYPQWTKRVHGTTYTNDLRLGVSTTKKPIRPTRSKDVDVTDVTASCVRFQQVGMRSESSVISAGRSPQFRESSDEPSPFVDIELHQAFVSHFQQEGLARFLIHDIGAFHDLVDFERLLAEQRSEYFLHHSARLDSHRHQAR
jgi:hypothetical protein